MTETMQPEDVPNDLANLAVTAWFGISDKNWGLEGLHQVMRICLAATLPEHERMVIDRIACQPPGSVVISEAEYAALKAERAGIEEGVRTKIADQIEDEMKRGWPQPVTAGLARAQDIALNGPTHPEKENRS